MGMFDEVVMVQDRVTGEMYDANQKFLEMMSSPEVMQVLNETFEQDLRLNTVPTLINFQMMDDQIKMVVVDNATAIQHELVSGG